MNQLPVIPDNAPFSAAQRIWLNGFLAGLFAQSSCGPNPSMGAASEKAATPLLVIFGSQTGTAEGLARRMASEASRRGFKPRVLEAAAAVTLDWSKESQVLIVTSTYGDGDMPDNARVFWDWLQTDAAKTVAHVRYAVLALGDRNYEHFCAAGQKLDARLEALGAARIYDRADCDVDYESTANLWLEGALQALGGAGAAGSTVTEITGLTPANSPVAPRAAADGYSRTNPFPARVMTNRKLTGEGSAKEVRHFEISLENSGLTYEAGDALGVWPTNCPTLVGELLEALQRDGEEAVPKPGGGEVSLRKALTNFYDITKPSRDLLQEIAGHNAVLRELLEPNRKAELHDWLRGREVIDLLLASPGIRFAPAGLVLLLKPLTPRLYSISSSPKAHAGQVHLTASIVRYDSHARGRKGVCSTFLADRSGGVVTVPVFVQSAHSFRLPANGDTPIIMLGPGTGVAPFRAFLHERRAAGAPGRNWLFFGEQKSATDFYYRDELEEMQRSGLLTKLSTAFSRDQSGKVYVQNRMLEEAATLWSWLQAGAHFYVCGDALRMARDVDAALHRVIETAGGRNPAEAQAFVNQLRTEKRYQRDVY